MTNQTVFSVSEFNEFINVYLNQAGEVCVEGEISEFKVNQGKWVFMTVKDSQASVEIFGMIYQLRNLKSLEVGMLVRVYGTPRLYQKTGRFSITAREVVPTGAGALQIAFEKLRLHLDSEGLFDISRKRQLPVFPEKIGLITAQGSQAYNDFTKVLGERTRGIKIYFYPAQVQGRESAQSLVQAIDYFSQRSEHLKLDLIVITRGGGSLEDLAAFNDEKLVRAIFGAKVPVVSGVGHEGDITLTDLVADLRASTPSNAAELIVRHRSEVLERIETSISIIKWRLIQLNKDKLQYVEYAVSTIKRNILDNLSVKKRLLERFSSQFKLFLLVLTRKKGAVLLIELRLESEMKNLCHQARNRLDNLLRLLVSLDYQRILERGFSITKLNGKILKTAHLVKQGDEIITQFAEGQVISQIK